jgi:uncharacterized protein YebE (UPF0316 family)
MDQVQKTAIVETAKTIGAITGMVFVVSAAIALLSLEVIATMLMVYCLGMGIKMIYDIKVSEARAAAYTKQADIDAEIDRLHK